MTSPSVPAHDVPTVRIRPRPGWRLPDPGELWRFRNVMWMLAVRDLKVRYKQTFLGVTWVIIQPLIAAGIFSFVFGGVARLEAPGAVPYFLFSFAGLIAWNLFSRSVSGSSSVLVASSHLLQKVYFPRLLLPLATLGSALVDFAVAACLLLVLLVAFWSLPSAVGVLVAVLCLGLLLVLGLGIGLAASAASVHYRDVQYLVPVFLQFLLYASPVAYAVDAVPDEYRLAFLLNPLAGLLETFRWGVLGVGRFDPVLLAYPAAFAVIMLVSGTLFFKRLERGFADVV